MVNKEDEMVNETLRWKANSTKWNGRKEKMKW